MRLMRRMNTIATQIGRFLYNLGNEFLAITGGWDKYSWTGNIAIWVGNSGGLSRQSSYMQVSMGDIGATGQCGVLRTANMVSLTGKSTIKIKVSHSLGACDLSSNGYQRIYLFLSKETSGSWTSPSVYEAITMCVEHDGGSTVQTDDVEYSLNISGLEDGGYYVCVGYVWRYQNAASWLRISEVSTS